MDEEWATLEEFPQYSVSTYGHVRSERTGRNLRPNLNQYYTVYVGLMGDDGVQYHRSLPLLVASTFIPQDNPHFDTPIQLDGIRTNCAVDNLVWRPRWFARQYNKQFKGRRSWTSHAIRDIETGEIFETARDCAMRFGLLEQEIIVSIANRTYVWPTFQTLEFVQP